MLLAIALFYRRELYRTSTRMFAVLFSLRSAAATLLLLALLQPVWRHSVTRDVALPVPVLIDVSASMWYPDPQGPVAEKLELSERLGLLPRGTRFKFDVFLEREISRISGDFKIARQPPRFHSTPTAKEIAAIKKQVETLKSVMTAAEGIVEKLSQGPSSPAILAKHVRRKAIEKAEKLANRCKTVIEQWKRLRARRTRPAEDYRRVARELRLAFRDVSSFLNDLEVLQEDADIALAGSGLPQVSNALETVSGRSRIHLLLHALKKSPRPLPALLMKKNVQTPVFIFGEDEPVDAEKQLDEEHLEKLRTSRTDFASEFARVFRRLDSRTGFRQVVLITDGRDNSGSLESEIIKIVQQKHLRVVALGIGSTRPVPDLGILNVQAPSRVFHGDRITIKAKLKWVGQVRSPVMVRVLIPPGCNCPYCERLKLYEAGRQNDTGTQ